MYYNVLKRLCQMVVSNNPVLSMVIGKEDFCAVSAAFYLKDSHVAELTAISNAQELAGREVGTFVACVLCRTSQELWAV
jgi:hypothetical protein